MIIIHQTFNTEDGEMLSKIYEGLSNIILLKDTSRAVIEETLKSFPNENAMLLGHGSRDGLFGKGGSYVIDGHNENLLQGRHVIGIWCYAAEFADKNWLHGFFTSMFISNLQEALMNSFFNNDSSEICEHLEKFCISINKLIKDKTPLREWVSILQSNADISIPFVRFNYEALTYFE